MEKEKVAILREETREFSEEFIIDASSFVSFKKRIWPLLNESFKIKFDFLVVFDENENGKYLDFNSQDYIVALLKDQIRYIESPSKSKADLEINKLLKARIENFDFELEIATMITGDNELFPYRTSYYLTRFFKELGFDFTHNGATKRFWVESQLKKLTIEDIYYVITKGIFKRRCFIESNKEIKLAKNNFADFIEQSIKNNEIIDLSDTFNLNVQNELLFNQETATADIKLNELVSKGRVFFLQNNIQEALEKIWDALERLKTLLDKDKKKGIELICKQLSDEIDISFFDNEYKALTDLGNCYQIRHFEIDKKPIDNTETKKYLFFRALSLINFTLTKIKNIAKD